MRIQSISRLAAVVLLTLLSAVAPAAAKTIRLVALGDSLTAGYGLAKADSFTVKLEAAMRAKGYDIVVENAGVSGDTVKGGLARLDWSVGPDTDAVLVELGGNDALRGLDPAATRASLDSLLARLKARHLPVLLAGMQAPRNLGPEYVQAFDSIFPDLARQYDAVLYPYFLEGLVGRPELAQPDGLHPNPTGVDMIVARILPSVEALLQRITPPS